MAQKCGDKAPHLRFVAYLIIYKVLEYSSLLKFFYEKWSTSELLMAGVVPAVQEKGWALEDGRLLTNGTDPQNHPKMEKNIRP